MATKKQKTTKKKPGLVFWRPDCVITVDGKEYKHGDPVDDWPAEALERHADKLRPAKK